MKKIFFLLVIFLIGSSVFAESYQRWIYWVNKPNHAATVADLVEIVTKLNNREISPWSVYKLRSGVTYKIPQPDLYLSYITMCVKSGEPSIITMDDVIRAIASGEVVRWGNDMSCLVKNYWFSTRLNKVTYTPNYSGSSFGVFVLLINKKPKIKTDCGNPLEPYDTTPVFVPNPKKVCEEHKPDTLVVKHIWENTKPISFDNKYVETQKETVDLGLTPVIKERKPFFKTAGAKIGEGIIAGIATYFLIDHWNDLFPRRVVYVETGGPAGAPGYPAGSPGYYGFHQTNKFYPGEFQRNLGLTVGIRF